MGRIDSLEQRPTRPARSRGRGHAAAHSRLLVDLLATQADLAQVRAALDTARADLAHLETSHAAAIAALQQTLDSVLTSKSWRLTAPLRDVSHHARHHARLLRDQLARRLERLLRRVYLRLPLTEAQRAVARRWGFAVVSPLLRGTLTYQHWHDSHRRACDLARLRDDPSRADAIAQLLDGLAFPTLAAASPLDRPLDACDVPDVSIVMPVHGQLLLTLRALQAVRRHWPRLSCEVIVVDDASPDDSAEHLARIPGLRLLRLAQNEGFIRASNTGARLARGRFLVFLNNDTDVQPDWCDELIRTFTDTPRAGIVGAKLLYPDGRLQEAGGLIWRDGSAWNYGRGDDPDRPEYSYRRDVDYVSGAALAIPRELFQRLGGFDERYLPAYGEDSDLAFKVRDVGRRVLYQPLARVIHTEGATAGTDPARGIKAHQVENARRLFERWQPRLRSRPRPGADVTRARDRDAGIRVLVLDHCTPEPDKDAGSITALNVMRLLQRLGCKVTFLPEDNFLALARYTADLQRLGIECHYAPFVTSVEAHLRDHGELYDLVVIFRFTTARRHLDTVRRCCGRAKVIVHTSDLHFLREQRAATLLADPDRLARAEATRHDELAMIRQADCTIVHSPVEQTLLRELCPEAPVRVFGWAIDVPGTTVPYEARRDLAFLGGYQHAPNVDAVHWFVREIFPLIKQRMTGVKLRVVGSHPPESVQALAAPDITITGFVPNLAEQLDQIRAAIAPLRYGAGIKGKVLTTMSHGLPGVITSIAAEGIGLRDGQDTLIADTPDAFADAVVALYTDRDLWNRLSHAGLEVVRDGFAFDAGLPIMRDLLDTVGLRDSVGLCDASSPPAALGPRSALAPQSALALAPSPTELERLRLTSQADYIAHLAADADRLAERAQIEARLRRHDAQPFFVDGYCIACHAPSRFRVGYEYSVPGPDGRPAPNWREHLVCSGSCGLNARTRLAMHMLTEIAGVDFDEPIYLMEQSSPLYRWLHRCAPALVGSEFLGDHLTPGDSIDGIRHEDATRLTFADESFARILSFDVFEHIPDFRRALAECARCLRPGGRLLFTVPFRADAAQTIVRARCDADGSIEHLLPPEWHGDPRRAGGVLCFQHFGWDLLDDLRTAGFHSAHAHVAWSRTFGYLGGEQIIFDAVK